jgi:hypothetical protein
MSDLISRKSLFKAMEEKYKIAEATGMYPTGLCEAFIIIDNIIREQPIAYDADKVVNAINLHIGDWKECARKDIADEHIKALTWVLDIIERSCKG